MTTRAPRSPAETHQDSVPQRRSSTHASTRLEAAGAVSADTSRSNGGGAEALGGDSARSASGFTNPVERNLNTISKLEAATVRARPPFVRFCDKITEQAGTTWSIMAHAMWFAAWMTINGVIAHPFDKFPYPLLTSVVSLEAIFLTLFVLASQNRLTQDSDNRTHLDLQVNLLAEQEMTLALRMLRELCVKNRVEVSQFQSEAELEADTDIQNIAERVQATLPNCETK